MKATKVLLSLVLVMVMNLGNISPLAEEVSTNDEIEEVTVEEVTELEDTQELNDELEEEIQETDTEGVEEDQETAETENATPEVTLMTPEVSAIFNDPGITLKNYSTKNGLFTDRNAYVYLKVGETLRFTASYVGNNSYVKPTDTGKYYITSPSGTQVSVAYPQGERQPTAVIPDPVHGTKSVQITATEEGIYVVSPSSAGLSETQHDLNFNIVNSTGSHQRGRVWFDRINFEQLNMLSTTGDFIYKNNYTIYHVLSTGFIYRQKLTGYNGLGSFIESDPVGIIDNRTGGCESIYADVTYSANTIYTTLTSQCKQRIKVNHLFLEMPDSTLPQAGTINLLDKNGVVTGQRSVHVLPLIADNMPSVDEITFARNTLATNEGVFTLDIKNHLGNVNLQIHIDYDNDGVIDETVTKSVLANSYGPTTYAWDGLNGAGEPVPMLSRIVAETIIDKAGEAHFLMSDLEVRSGMSVERLTAINPANVGDGTLYYDASKLPLDLANSYLVSLPSPVKGSYDSLANPTFRGWGMTYYGSGDPRNSVAARLPSYEGRPTSYTPGEWYDPAENNWSYGDGNYIDEWTYEPVDIRNVVEIPVIQPDVIIEKEVDKQVANIGETIMYTLKVTNNELFAVPNINVSDVLKADGNTEYVIDSITLDGVDMTDVLDTDLAVFEDNTVKIIGLEIDAEQELLITFKLKIKNQAEGQTILNVASMELPNVEDAVESNEVETYVPWLPRVINYYDCDEILIHQEWVDYGGTGKEAPKGYIYDLGGTINVTRNIDVYALGGVSCSGGYLVPNTAVNK